MKKYKNIFLLIIVFLLVPTFFRMLRPGIYSMQDFHFFRLYEFSLCMKDWQIPCRWAPDAGFGYGEPLFNFYPQLPYLIGYGFYILGFSLINSLKLLFIFSLVVSGLSMFFLAKRVWKDSYAALISAVLYVYAPYRAVDVWVRGALPEALAFVFFPLILLVIDRLFEKKNLKDWFVLAVLVAILINIHNLSFVMFLPIMAIWIILRFYETRCIKCLIYLAGSLIYSGLISAFYILPVLAESNLVNLDYTTHGYFDFRGHFISLYQMLFSRYWGYGASVFGTEDGLNLSVGYLQWVLPLVIFLIVVFKRKILKYKELITLLIIGWFLLFLTHNKSTFIWQNIDFAKYIQFPWRFLGVAVFVFSLASGAIALMFKKYKKIILIAIILLAIGLNFSFFREDIWQERDDKYLLTDRAFEEQTVASIGDYWPKYGGIPTSAAQVDFVGGAIVEKKSNKITAKLDLDEPGSVSIPVAYFPGWRGKVDGRDAKIYPNKDGYISLDLEKGEKVVVLKFVNTPIRTVGNAISLFVLAAGLIYIKRKYAK